MYGHHAVHLEGSEGRYFPHRCAFSGDRIHPQQCPSRRPARTLAATAGSRREHVAGTRADDTGEGRCGYGCLSREPEELRSQWPFLWDLGTRRRPPQGTHGWWKPLQAPLGEAMAKPGPQACSGGTSQLAMQTGTSHGRGWDTITWQQTSWEAAGGTL